MKILGKKEHGGKVFLVHFHTVHPEDLAEARKWGREITGK